jgi:4-alpha-glucanotransferase
MKVNFYVRFKTVQGQCLSITGSTAALGNNEITGALPMQYVNDEFWHAAIDIDVATTPNLQYNYIFIKPGAGAVKEWGNDRVLNLQAYNSTDVQVIDTWNNAGEFENTFFTAPFTKTLLKAVNSTAKQNQPKHYTHLFKVKAPLLQKHEVICLAGSSVNLGEWQTKNPVLFTKEANWWVAKVNMPKEGFPLFYKYGIYNTKHKAFVNFEMGNNRVLYNDAQVKRLTILHDGFAYLPNNTWRGAGIAIPVFSLRSKNSFGVGEFSDINLLVNWANKTGLSLIQLLPVNDTSATNTFTDSYPYAAISAFALHPVYININEVAGKKHAAIIKSFKKKQKELNELPALDYEQVYGFKIAALKELYAAQKQEFLNDEDYQQFFETNKHWLVPYAAFCYLKEKNGTSDFSKWKIYNKYEKDAIEKYVSPRAKHYDSIALQYFIQYYLHVQLKKATAYAHKNGVIVKGDIPIGIYRHSCDAWVQPGLYNMHVQAGAPPDDFAVKGQNWGFPTYNWQKMEEDNFAWWKQRFAQMSNYFDAFRIDHILGFFRIWSIPVHAVEGIMGRFVPAIAVHISEFHQKNIWFDYYRYTKPFITDDILYKKFGDANEYIKTTFLNNAYNNQYDFKEAFDTQVKIAAYFSTLAITDHNNYLKQGLFDLIANIILFEEENAGSQKFHFRIAVDETSSFQNLEWNTQQQLKELYVNYFFRRQDDFWYTEAMHKLPALKASTNMLVCGEDLGMVPACVHDVMSQLGILSLEIQRMPKNPAREFFHPNDAPYLSVVTPSTHDMSTIRGWWEENRDKTQRFYNHELGQWGEAPVFCEPWINKLIVLQHLHSPAMWSIFQLQDLFGMSQHLRRQNPQDERINIPADPRHYWQYRMHITLEQLLKEKEFNDELKEYVHVSGRK